MKKQGTMGKPREFCYEPDKGNMKAFDAYHALMMRYEYDFTWVDDEEELNSIEELLKHITTQFPAFFDAQMELYQFYMMLGEKGKKAAPYLETAYTLALEMIKDKKGNWPDVMDWLWLENRNVIRALIGGSLTRWKSRKEQEALEVLRNILKANPADNPGVRFLILALREKMSYAKYTHEFESQDGTLDNAIWGWFEQGSKKYPVEFALYEKATAEMME